MKSAHNYNRFEDIPNVELTNFINPINISLKVKKDSIYDLFVFPTIVVDYINQFYDEVFKYIPSMPKVNKTNFIKEDCSISYVAHTAGYDFRFNPTDFINSLFKHVKIDYEIPFINLDNGYGINYLKDCARAYIEDFKRDETQKVRPHNDIKTAILDEVYDNLDSIVAMYNCDLTSMISTNVRAKDMLLYLAFESLNQFEQTHDDKYLVLPFEYYHYVSHMNTSPWPHMVRFNGTKLWFEDFRQKYVSNISPDAPVDDKPYMLDDNEVLIAWDILKPGMVEREIKDVIQTVRSSPNVDYDKYLELFRIKMNYYMNSPYIKYIKGKYGLLGYMGFSYQNEYLIFDKFHNSDTIDPSKKTILTHGEAIYALPADRFSVISNKQKIIAAKKADSRIRKLNHTPNYSFLGKLDDIIQGPNVSTQTFAEVIEEQKKRILIKKEN